MYKIITMITLVLLMSVSPALPAAAQDGVEISNIDLGDLGGGRSIAYATNDMGQIIGDSPTESWQWHAFLWENDILTDLGTLGGSQSSPTGINEMGHVAGYSQISSGEYHACLWQGGAMTDLGTLGRNFYMSYAATSTTWARCA